MRGKRLKVGSCETMQQKNSHRNCTHTGGNYTLVINNSNSNNSNSHRKYERMKNLKRMRNIAKECCTNTKVVEYVEHMSHNIDALVAAYTNYYYGHTYNNSDGFEKNALQSIREVVFHSDDVSSAGQVFPEDIDAVLYEGNLRERMTLAVENFPKKGCHVLLWAINKAVNGEHASLEGTNASINAFKKKAVRLRKLSGLSIDKLLNMNENDELKRWKSTSGKKSCNEAGMISANLFYDVKLDEGERQQRVRKCRTLPCTFATLFSETTTIPQMSPTFPMLVPLREQRQQPMDSPYLVKDGVVYPPLSEREKNFIAEKLGDDIFSGNDDVVLPWVSGLMHWKAQPYNYYARLSAEYGHLLVAGVSGHTDFACNVFSLFEGFDIELTVLACVAYMCNPPDHSPFEILMAALPFGLDYTADQDAFVYVKNLIDKNTEEYEKEEWESSIGGGPRVQSKKSRGAIKKRR